jgi:hypothetical protein
VDPCGGGGGISPAVVLACCLVRQRMPGSLPARQVLLQSKIIIHFPKEAIGGGGGEKKKKKIRKNVKS